MTKKSAVFVIVLVLSVLGSMGLFALQSAATTEAQTDYSEYTVITTVEELLSIADDMSGKYCLGSDIVFDTSDSITTGIGGSNAVFEGVLDGRGYSIKNLTLVEQTFAFNGAALFYKIGESGSVIDLTIDGLLASGSSYTTLSCIAVTNEGLIENVTVKNIAVNGESSPIVSFAAFVTKHDKGTIKDVTLDSVTTANIENIAGIAGTLNGGVIDGATVQGITVTEGRSASGIANSITHSDSFIRNIVIENVNLSAYTSGTVNIAGAVNNLEQGSVKNVKVSNLDIIGTSSANSLIGGIVGKASANTVIDTVELRGSDTQKNTFTKAGNMGGIVGELLGLATKCHVSFTEMQEATCVGGIAGSASGTVSLSQVHDSYLSGFAVGGISGWTGVVGDVSINGTISDSYVYNNSVITNSTSNRKGLLSGTNGIVSHCFAIDALSNVMAVGAETTQGYSDEGMTRLSAIEARAALALMLNSEEWSWSVNVTMENGFPYIGTLSELSEYREAASSGSYKVIATETTSTPILHYGDVTAAFNSVEYTGFKYYYEGMNSTMYPLTEDAPSEIGEYRVYAIANEAMSLDDATSITVSGSYSYEYKIIKVGYEDTLQLNGFTAPYNGANRNVTLSLTDESSPDTFFLEEGIDDSRIAYRYYYIIDEEKGFYIEKSSIMDAGDYLVTAAIPSSANFEETLLSVKVGITKKELTVTVDDIEIIYGNLAGTMSICYEGFVDGENNLTALSKQPVTYTDDEYDLTELWDVGVYTDILKVKDGSALNYSFIYVYGTLTVNYATFENISFEGRTTIYNEQEQYLSIQGNVPENSTVRYVYGDEEPSEAFSKKNVGSYDVKVLVTNPNYNNYEKTVSFIINKADLIGVEFSYQPSHIYDGESVYYATVNMETLPISLRDMDPLSFIAYQGNTGVTNVGMHKVVAEINGGANYNSVSITTFIEIMPLAVKVTAPNITTMYKDAISVVTLTYAYIGNDGTDVLFTEGSGEKPQAITGLNVTAVVDWVDEHNASVSDIVLSCTDNANYSVTLVDGKYTIAKATLTAKVRNQIFTYGETPSTEIEYSGFLGGDTLETISVYTTFPTLVGMPTVEDNAGNYTVRAKDGYSKNYVFLIRSATIIILKAELENIVFENVEVVYDGLPHSILAELPSGSEQLEVAYSETNLVNAGTYEIVATIQEQTNYLAWSASAKLTISPKIITLIAPTISAVYGEAFYLDEFVYTVEDIAHQLIVEPDITATLDCIVNSDNASVTKVGSYQIAFSGDYSMYTNYDISFQSGVYNIGKAPFVIKAIETSFNYGETISIPTQDRLTYSGFVGNDSLDNMSDWLSTVPMVAIPASGIDAGYYPIAFDTFATAENYDIEHIEGSVTINKISLLSLDSFSFDDLTVTYDGMYHSITISETGGNNVLGGIYVEYSGGNQRNVGTYTVTTAIRNNTNYLDEVATATLKIESVALTVSGLSVVNKQYDGNTDIQILGGVVSGLVPGDGIDSVSVYATGSTEAADASETPYAVTLSITLVGTNAGNYVVNKETLPQLTAVISKMRVYISGTVSGKDRAYSLDGSRQVGLDFTNAKLFYVEQLTEVDAEDLRFSDSSSGIAEAAIGNNLAVSDINVVLSGMSAENYMLTNSPYDVYVNITKQSIFEYAPISERFDEYFGENKWSIEGDTITLSYQEYIYNGNEYALDLFDESILNLSAMNMPGVSAQYADDSTAVAAGIYTATMTVDGGTYFENGVHTIVWNINPYEIEVVEAYAIDKEYDGTTNAGDEGHYLNCNMPSFGDDIELSVTSYFISPTAGSVDSVLNVVIVGEKAVNYVIKGADKQENGSFNIQSTKQSTISPRKISVEELTVENRVYDGSTEVELEDGIITDTVALQDGISFEIIAKGVLDSKAAGARKVSIENAIVLACDDQAMLDNYELVFTLLDATITPKALSLAEVGAKDREYDGTDIVMLTGGELSGIVDGDDVGINLSTGRIQGSNVGTYNEVELAVDSFELNGIDKDNYTVILPEPTTISVAISQRAIRIEGITAENREYDGTDFVVIQNGVITDEVAIANGIGFQLSGANAASINVGETTAVCNIRLTGELASNFVVNESVSVTITRRALTISARSYTIKVDRKLPDFGYDIVGLVTGDLLTGSLETEADGKTKGQFAITIGTLSAGDNYEITFVEGVLTVKGKIGGWIALGILGGFALIFISFCLIVTIQGKSVKLVLRKMFGKQGKTKTDSRIHVVKDDDDDL